jgi:hypothetical protein
MFNVRIRDQWIAPTFNRHFNDFSGLGSAMFALSLP